ncbi:hypothetical protein AA103196_1296 [Ameyamaea chiangmaiensis NBRC 103196]|nr:hypothetical protein [Ameyamaea chiangmaiensis]GBQ66114.1 hypothetical protein AA103196_1296 [Ameyamaea chiangmaiensis NBRC 103196]
MLHAPNLSDLSCSERLTIWTVRRLARRRTGAPAASAVPAEGLFLPCFRRDFDDVATAFSTALDRLATVRGGALDIAIPRAQALTATEACLLDATTAAQAGEEATMRRILRRLFPHHHILAPFAAAVTQLGACLAGAGHWLPRPRAVLTAAASDGVPADQETRRAAASLSALVRWHDLDMGTTHVLWPQPDELAGHRLHA